MNRYPQFSDLVGMNLAAVLVIRDEPNIDDLIEFITIEGRRFRLYHSQDCCESVCINDIEGDVNDLVGSTVTLAEEASNGSNDEGAARPEDSDESWTWTFYRIATSKGFVTIRWFGTSNGYYSESVDFREVTA